MGRINFNQPPVRKKQDDITIKTPEEIIKMRLAGRLAADVLVMIEPFVKEGITTNELDKLCHEYMVKQQRVIPAPLNYRGFPKSICTSVNQQVCHGIPSHKPLKNGDIINIDITVIKDGFHGDTSKMFVVGEPSPLAKRLVQGSYDCLRVGIEQVKPGAMLSDIGKAIQKLAKSQRFSVVQDYCGHGIGREFHEQPQVLHYYSKKAEPVELKAGMTFTIEPMINAGKHQVKRLSDEWTVVTKDRSLSAQWEHTLLVTDSGFEVLTLREEEQPFH
ncbi:MAG: type I methionyl aminopeptidase [Thiotrichaceae bacterium]|nr:type I methionyl aminopeptidase [Thiotrichaceae bacterium]